MYQFSNELAATTMGSGKNLDFRAACLNLIRKHFGYKSASFNVFKNPLHLESLVNSPNLDNMTIGLPDQLLREYYNTYFKLDPLVNPANKSQILRLSDIITAKDLSIRRLFPSHKL